MFAISPHGWNYFIHIKGECSVDWEVARLLHMSPEKYRLELEVRFNAFIDEEVYLPTKEDAEKALEWVESVYIITLLAG